MFISDGGGWCDTVAPAYFHDAERILDWYHLAEHVWNVGRALYSNGEAAKWVSRWTGLLRQSSGFGLLRYLECCR